MPEESTAADISASIGHGNKHGVGKQMLDCVCIMHRIARISVAFLNIDKHLSLYAMRFGTDE